MLIIGPVLKVDSVKSDIMNRWKRKALGPVDTLVGILDERNRSQRTIQVHQTAYTRKLLQRLKMDKSIPKSLTLPTGTVLRSLTENNLWYILENTDAGLYRQIVGSILYLSNSTRPNISYAVGQIARFMSNPNSVHLSMVKHLLRYLNGNRSLGIM
ncbi:hypothetical protein K3495_g8085 [Podosphaera aphanis]|nr:hypothetical protein K3495_g8085 [Podosphaera aphanis]